MPHRLKSRQKKIQNQKKNNSRKDFVKDVCSWRPLILHKNNGLISRFPKTWREWILLSKDKMNEIRDELLIEKNYYEKDFFTSYAKLWKNTPKETLINLAGTENCDFSDVAHNSKNWYLSYNITTWCENICYSFSVKENSKNIYNTVLSLDSSENVYFCSWVIKSYKVFYSKYIMNSSDIRFSSNLVNCKHCISCSNLDNKSYCIANKQYSKEEYIKQKSKILNNKHNFKTPYSVKWENYWSTNVNWSFNLMSEDTNWHRTYQVKNANNVLLVWGNEWITNGYDIFIWWAGWCYNIYWLQGWGFLDQIYNSIELWFSSNIYYSYFLDNCSYCLGCIWLKNKSYCILNKQYTKEERYDKVDEIFTQMEKDWQLWKFFPGSMNPFYFNDTAAYLIDDTFTKEEVEAEWYLRRDEKIKVDIPDGAEIVFTENWNDIIDNYQWRKIDWKFYPLSQLWNRTPKAESNAERYINSEILKKVIQNKKWDSYRIVKLEYDFLMKHKLPLPKLHRLDRIKLGFKFK